MNVSDMCIEAKVGQMMIFGFAGLEADDHVQKMVSEWGIGGVVLFKRNCRHARQVAELNQHLQTLAAVPLFIATDQEGGSVARLTSGASVSPGNMALGAAGDPQWTGLAARVTGSELQACGINMNLAPVLDVSNNPENPVIGVRSFGEDPQLVAELGAAAVEGYQHYVAAVAKHFPGHGDTSVDSHRAMPSVDVSMERLEAVELVPFRRAIAGGVTAVMTAHIYFPAIEPDPGVPATLSSAVLTDLLRQHLGFGGLILTDCMEMDAIAKGFGTTEAAVRTIEAGADCVLVSHTPTVQRQCLEAVLEAVKTGRISEERVDRSVGRILAAKERFVQPVFPENLETLDIGFHQDSMANAAAAAVTAHGRASLLPLDKSQRLLVVETIAGAETVAEDVMDVPVSLGGELQEMGYDVQRAFAVPDVEPEDMEPVVAAAAERDIIVFVSQDAHRFPEQARLLAELAAMKPLIVMGGKTPYELRAMPEDILYLAAYGMQPANVRGMAAVLSGKAAPGGRFPVSV